MQSRDHYLRSPSSRFFQTRTCLQFTDIPEEREALLYQFGADQVITLRFDASVAGLTAPEFLTLMKKHLGIEHLLAGIDFALGKNRTGTIPELIRLGIPLGIDVEIVTPLLVDDLAVSSSQIRQMLQNGELHFANEMLGQTLFS